MHAVMIFSVCWILSSFKTYSHIAFGTKDLIVYLKCVYKISKTMKVMSLSFQFQLNELKFSLCDICIIINEISSMYIYNRQKVRLQKCSELNRMNL